MHTRILVIEDEPSQLELLCYNLKTQGYEPLRADNAETGLLILKETNIDLILLDWMLPHISGLEMCRQIKSNKQTSHIPVIMLTARGEEDDKIRGLDVGADDYIVKPYAIKELMARVRALLRRNTGNAGENLLTYDRITMNLTRHLVQIDDSIIHLSPLEFNLLRIFLETPARVFSREQLLERIWHNHIEVETRTVDMHIARLRKHLMRVSNVNYIRTVHGFGYSLDQI